MSEMHFKQPGLTYSTYGSFTENKTSDSRYTYQKEQDKTCFQHDRTYGYFKDLPRRTATDKVLCDKAFNIAKKSKYDGYQKGLASM